MFSNQQPSSEDNRHQQLNWGETRPVPRANQTLRVHKGCAWVMLAGRDFFVKAGHSISLEQGSDPATISAIWEEGLTFELQS